MMQEAKRKEAAAVSLCCMTVGDETFGINTAQVHEVLGQCVIQAVPLSPGFVGGVTSYRGDVLPVVCFRRLLKMTPTGAAPSVLVLRDEVEGEPFGLAVDAATDVVVFDASDFEENPCTLSPERKALFAGVYKADGSVVMCLDSELLRPSRLLELMAEEKR